MEPILSGFCADENISKHPVNLLVAAKIVYATEN